MKIRGEKMIAPKLQLGEEIRIVAPSDSMCTLKSHVSKKALKILSKEFKVTQSKHCNGTRGEYSTNIVARVEDIHKAFEDPRVKMILACAGGYNVNQILEYLDYDLIRNNPKILCGFSDITALINAIYAKTGLVTYHGADFSVIGSTKDLNYTYGYFKKCLINEGPYFIEPSKDAKRYYAIQEGEAEGKIVGGNICTLNLLQGTEFMPDITDKILFLEDQYSTDEFFVCEFDRDLESLLQIQGVPSIKGLVFGRFDERSKMTMESVKQMIGTKKKLKDIPIAFNVDFGHMKEMVTFPIGGTARLSVQGEMVNLEILEH